MNFFGRKPTAARSAEAEISPDFREGRRAYPVKTHLVLNPWSTIKKIDKGEESYFFMERKGVDSVAFILFDALRANDPFGLIHQYRGNFGEWQIGCFTGSLDKPELEMIEIVKEEVKEESGYDVPVERITYITTECAGSQSNERVHLYFVDVTGLPPGELAPESDQEVNTETVWNCETGVIACHDWKAKLIILSCLRNGMLRKPTCCEDKPVAIVTTSAKDDLSEDDVKTLETIRDETDRFGEGGVLHDWLNAEEANSASKLNKMGLVSVVSIEEEEGAPEVYRITKNGLRYLSKRPKTSEKIPSLTASMGST